MIAPLVAIAESHNFEFLADHLAEHILAYPKARLFIDGLTCTGKSTLSKAVITRLGQHGRDVAFLSTDMFLIDRAERNYRSDARLMSLANWYHDSEVSRVLPMILANPPVDIKFQAYDRSTG